MKALLLLAIGAIAAPTVASAGHHPHASDYCGNVGYRPSYYPSYGYYAPPVLSFSFGNRPTYYSETRYYSRNTSSLGTSVQRALRREGYYAGPVDGDIGPISRYAIREYQADHGMPVTGRIDSRLLRSLGI